MMQTMRLCVINGSADNIVHLFMCRLSDYGVSPPHQKFVTRQNVFRGDDRAPWTAATVKFNLKSKNFEANKIKKHHIGYSKNMLRSSYDQNYTRSNLSSKLRQNFSD